MRSISSANPEYAPWYALNRPSHAVARLGAARADAACEVLVHPVGDVEVLVLGHPEEALGRLHALDAERLAVRLG